MEKVKLNIDIISDDAYYHILSEFKKQFGKNFSYTEWEIIAVKEEK